MAVEVEEGREPRRMEAMARPWTDRFSVDADRRYVSDGQVPRALGLILSIVAESADRGMRVIEPSDALFDMARERRWMWPHVVVRSADDHLFSFHLAEASRSGTAPKPRSFAASRGGAAVGAESGLGASPDGFGQTPAWIVERSREFEPTGVLSVSVDNDMESHRRRVCRDSGNSHLETRLPNLFDALAADIRFQRRRLRRDEEFERAEREARVEVRGEQLYTALCAEVRLYEALRAQREYLDRVERRLRDHDPDALRESAGDIERMRRRIDERDPLLSGGTEWTHVPDPSEMDVFEYRRRGRRLNAFEEGRCASVGAGAARSASAPSGFFD